MQNFSPFDKAIHDLQSTDLTILRNVHEGWYVEYKRKEVSAKALAKSLSAFANTYGGWLFIGVQEKSGDNAVAGKFPGILDKDVDGVLQRLRHSAADHLNPTPFFKTKVLRGPCSEVELDEGRVIIAVEIPQSHTTPHVHRDGRIYRRVADGSEPKPETDRFILDQLWRRAEPLRKRTREWIERDPEFSEGEEEIPYIRILFCLDPWRQHTAWLDARLSEIRSILGNPSTNIWSVPFDTVYTTAEGFIARQLKGNDPHNFVMTWRIQPDLSCEIIIPLPFYTARSPDELIIHLSGYDNASLFISILKGHQYHRPRIADLNQLMSILIGVVSTYRCLLELANTEGKFFFKARILNAWRIVPFVDIDRVLRGFEEHGIPMMIEKTVTMPPGNDPNTFSLNYLNYFKELEAKEYDHKEQIVSFGQAYVVFAYIAEAFGVLTFLDGETENDKKRIYSELKAAAKRAMIVQKNRKEMFT